MALGYHAQLQDGLLVSVGRWRVAHMLRCLRPRRAAHVIVACFALILRCCTLPLSSYASTTALRPLTASARSPQSTPSCMGTTSLHLLHNLTGCDQLQPPRAGGEPVRPAGRGRIHLFRLLPTRRLGTAHSNVQHGPGGRLTGFSARFDSRNVISTDRSRDMPTHSCI